MDPLSDILSLLRPQSYVSAGFEAGGDWSLRFQAYEGIKCNAVVSGQCWLEVDGVAEPVRLKPGDCFLMTKGRAFRMASDLALPSVDAATVFPPARRGGVARLDGGGDFFLVGSRFMLSGDHADILLGVLPPVVHIRKAHGQATLRWVLDLMRRELRDPQPGASLVAEHLAHLMLVQALRIYLASGMKGDRNGSAHVGVGWLFALADKQIGAAIDRMHADPARRWTVQQLAEAVGMSRTSFAVRFRQTVGLSPMDYLTRWRMLLAGERLTQTNAPIGAIAAALGYESESAFSAAFKRIMGASPRRYRPARAAAPPRRPVGAPFPA